MWHDMFVVDQPHVTVNFVHSLCSFYFCIQLFLKYSINMKAYREHTYEIENEIKKYITATILTVQ